MRIPFQQIIYIPIYSIKKILYSPLEKWFNFFLKFSVNFNISENNRISVELAQVLRYWTIWKIRQHNHIRKRICASRIKRVCASCIKRTHVQVTLSFKTLKIVYELLRIFLLLRTMIFEHTIIYSWLFVVGLFLYQSTNSFRLFHANRTHGVRVSFFVHVLHTQVIYFFQQNLSLFWPKKFG